MDENRFIGCLLGLAVGDALGTTLEFSPPRYGPDVLDDLRAWKSGCAPEGFHSEMVGGGPFDLPAGAWTDDTSMAIGLGVSLIERMQFVPADVMDRWCLWWRHGENSSTGRCFDIGVATASALQRYLAAGTPDALQGMYAPDAGGNGVLMRLAPLAMFFAAPPRDAVKLCRTSAYLTHGHPAAIDACQYFGGLLVGALRGVHGAELLSQHYSPLGPDGLEGATPFHSDAARVAGGAFRAISAPSPGGYAPDALQAALWAFLWSESFEDGALLAVNLGGDADTVGAIYGQFAGAYYGIDAIPERWLDRLVERDRIEALAQCLYTFGGEQ